MSSQVDMARERVYLVLWLASGAYLTWFLAHAVSLRFAGRVLTPCAGCYPSPWLVVFAVPVLLVARGQYRELRKRRILGTRAAKHFPHLDPVLGLDWVLLMRATLKSDTLLETWHRLFHSVATTYWVNAIGRWTLMTCDPDNCKAILAGQFDTWVVGGVRQKSISLVLGPHAIFSSNGTDWAQARALIRPSFVRNQIADLECTDRHVENLLARLLSQPRGPGVDGDDRVDLQALFYMFTMDTSSDFMSAALLSSRSHRADGDQVWPLDQHARPAERRSRRVHEGL